MLYDDLKARLKGKILVVGVGNEQRGDDGYGPRMIQRLEGKVDVALLDVGEAPENYLGRISNQQAQTILVLDAANFGEEPGTAAILEVEDMDGATVSTHGIPLKVFFSLIRTESKSEIFCLSVQPLQFGQGSFLSASVESSVEILSETLIAVINEASHEKRGARSKRTHEFICHS